MIRSNDSLWGEHAKLGALDNDPTWTGKGIFSVGWKVCIN